MNETERKGLIQGDVSRFTIFDLLLATTLAAGPLGFQTVIGWKAAIFLMMMALILTLGSVFKPIVMRLLLPAIALLTGGAIAASAVSMSGLAVSFGWLFVVVLTPLIWQSRRRSR